MNSGKVLISEMINVSDACNSKKRKMKLIRSSIMVTIILFENRFHSHGIAINAKASAKSKTSVTISLQQWLKIVLLGEVRR